jgi:ABC-type branched-subunit amino acid transport system substrate-binding protein
MMKKVDPKAKNVAMLYEDDEFSRSVRDGALQYMKSGGFKVVFDRTYPSQGHQMNLDLRFWIDEMNAENLPSILCTVST